MDSLVSQIIALSGNEKDLEVLATKKLKDVNKTLSKNRGAIDSALDSIDPRRHTLGYIALLAFLAEQEHINVEQFVRRTRRFLLVCEPNQVTFAPHKFAIVACKFGDLLFEGHPLFAIKPLQVAIMKLQAGNPHLLTAIHQIFVLCCIKAKCYQAARTVIDSSIYEIDGHEDNPLKPKDNLLYHYYAAVVYTGFKNRKRALECLAVVLTAPSSTLSAIQVAAYKKYILLSLLLHGKVISLPRYTSPCVTRNVEKLCQPYLELVEAYVKGMEMTNSVCSAHIDRFSADENFGLIKQVLRGLTKRNIKKLTDTYLTLSLEHIAQRVDLQNPVEAEKLLLTMIEEGEISAQIDQEKGMVSFLDDDEDYSTQQMVEGLDRRIQEVMLFWQKVSDSDREISLETTFISKNIGQSQKGYDASDDQDMLLAQQASLEEHNAMRFA